jgi:hypothetical protein
VGVRTERLAAMRDALGPAFGGRLVGRDDDGYE